MFKIVFFVVFVVSSSFAYNFNDATFNEMIFDTLQYATDYLDDSHSLRLRRDADSDQSFDEGCRWRKYFRGLKCCNVTANTGPDSEMIELSRECFKTIRGNNDDFHFDPFSCEKIEERKMQAVCISECIAKKKQIVDDNGGIIRDAFVEHMKSKLTSEAYKWKLDATEKIIDKCLEEMRSTEIPANMKPTTMMKCNPSALRMVHCMWREYERACPVQLQIESDKCTKLRERLENGEEIGSRDFMIYRRRK